MGERTEIPREKANQEGHGGTEEFLQGEKMKKIREIFSEIFGTVIAFVIMATWRPKLNESTLSRGDDDSWAILLPILILLAIAFLARCG
jgi:hypothetical protein